MIKAKLNKSLYKELKNIAVYGNTNYILIHESLKLLKVEFKFIEDNINYVDDSFVIDHKNKVYVIRLNAINFDYNKRKKGAGEHFHIVPTVPQLFELKNIKYCECSLKNLGFNYLLCHEDNYLKQYTNRDYIVPAGSNKTHEIKNNMPYLDCSKSLKEQIEWFLSVKEISSLKSFVISKEISTNIFEKDGYLSKTQKVINMHIETSKKELKGDNIYVGKFYSSYFRAIKKEGKIIYSPFSYNYKLFNN